MATLNDWWASLTIAQKERIATKACNADNQESFKRVFYPACTVWWNSLDADQQTAIHDHCTDKHGYLLKEWNEGMSLSY